MIPRLTFAHVRDIKDATGLDLMQIADAGVWAKVSADVRWNAEVAQLLTGEELSGDALGDYMRAFMARVEEFYPEPTKSNSDANETDTNANPWQAVFQAAGAAGVEPWSYSMRELLWMADGAWRPFSSIIAKMHNVNIQKRSDAITPDSVNPYSTAKPKKTRRRYPKAHLLDG